MAGKDPWHEIYEEAEREAAYLKQRKQPDNTPSPYWWVNNPNGWCPACHRHRFNADYHGGRCYVCHSMLTEVGSDLHSIARRQMYARWEYDLYGYDDDNGKELWLMAKPDIVVDRDAHAYVMEVVAECPGEVGGLGYVERLSNGDLRIYEFALIKQEVSSGGVEFDDDAMHEFLTKSAERDDNENLRVSWHSHGNMACYFSATDTGDAIPKYKAAGIPWLLSLIFNRKGEIKTRLDVFDSEALDQIYMEDLVYLMERPQSVVDQAIADVKELVHERKHQQAQWKQGKKVEPSKSKADEGKKKDPDTKESSKTLVVPPKGRKGKQERKRLRRSLAARSDFSASEIGEMEIEEVIECLAYINLMDSRTSGHGVLSVGDDLPDEFNGKRVADLTEREWVAYCEANEIPLDPASKRMLLAKADDEWGGVV